MRIFGISLVIAIGFASCSTKSEDATLASGEGVGSCADLESKVYILEAQIQQSKAGKDAVLEPTNTAFALNEYETTVPAAPIRTTGSGTASANTGAKPQNTILASLEARLAAAKVELQECYNKKFGESKLPKPTTGNQGHCDYKGQPYDILNYNCHSAANESVRDEPKVTGIVSCNGLAPFQGSPAHHTFNYRVEGTSIVYYNWGKTCTAPKGSVPPDLLDPDHLRCAQAFCGDQYKFESTQAFDPGKQVEEPGPQFCANHSAVSTKDQCDSCCRFRGNYWDLIPGDLRPTDATFIGFSSQCFSACSQRFPSIR